jgi:hypothetical protein
MPIPEGASFCEACGAEIQSVAAPAPESAPEPRDGVPKEEGQVAESGAGKSAEGVGALENLLAGVSFEQLERVLAEVQASSTPQAPLPSKAPTTPVTRNSAEPTPPSASTGSAATGKSSDSPHHTASFGSHCVTATANSLDMPFDFEWDNAREFIEGVLCNFAFRLRINAPVETLTIKAVVGGETLACNPFTSLAAGDERKGTLPFIPKVAGALSVSVFAEVCYKKGCCESFEAVRSFEHQASPFRRFLSEGDQNVEIKIDGNSGLIRLDELKLPRQAIIDLKEEINLALSRRDGWESVILATSGIRREVVNLCTGERMLTVVSGANPVTFGRSSRRAAIQLLAETEDGQIDEYRSGFVSGVHFTLMKSNAAVMLRDGGLEDVNGRKSWRKSKNGVSFNDRMISSDQKISLGRTAQVVLAPYVVPGGAVSISLEAHGHSPDISGCDRACELASVTVLRDDVPDRAALVVWGAAEIDDFLGTRTGLRIGLIRGRLRLIRPDGSSKRLLHLVGTVLPGTDIFVQ